MIACGLNGAPWAQFRPRVTVIEIPNANEKRAKKINPQNLITLAYRAGKVASCCEAQGSEVLTYFPSEWKGTASKDVHIGTIVRALPPRCLRVLDMAITGMADSLAHNVIDAVGLGKWLHHQIVTREKIYTPSAQGASTYPTNEAIYRAPAESRGARIK